MDATRIVENTQVDYTMVDVLNNNVCVWLYHASYIWPLDASMVCVTECSVFGLAPSTLCRAHVGTGCFLQVAAGTTPCAAC